jgi:hypothetical protein
VIAETVRFAILGNCNANAYGARRLRTSSGDEMFIPKLTRTKNSTRIIELAKLAGVGMTRSSFFEVLAEITQQDPKHRELHHVA